MNKYANTPRPYHYFLPPEKPPEVQPVKFRDKPVSLLDRVTELKASKMAEVGLYTMGDLLDFYNAGRTLKAEVYGIGAKYEADIRASFDSYYQDYLHIEGLAPKGD